MNAFYRYLDSIDPHGRIQSANDLRNEHGSGFQAWLDQNGQRNTKIYSTCKTLISGIRDTKGLRRLAWPARRPDSSTVLDDIDERSVRAAFNALKREARAIQTMLKEGAELAKCGRDPRRGHFASQGAGWRDVANHAFILRELTAERLLSLKELRAAKVRGLSHQNDPAERHQGPQYLAPGMPQDTRTRFGVAGKLRWFHLGLFDTGVFLWLFLLGTGWNLGTALALDIDNWEEDHPLSPDLKIIHAYKGRSDKHQFAISMKQPEWHPYRIVRFMIDNTKVLRATLRYQLKESRNQYALTPDSELKRQIQECEAKLKSPWLYFSGRDIGAVSTFKGASDITHFHNVLRATVERHALTKRYPSLVSFKSSDARDAWIGYAYQVSGYSITIAMLASQHGSAAMLRHYLKSPRYRRYSEKQVARVQRAAFTEIAERRPLDPTRLRLLVEQGYVTDAQAQRLADKRLRTRLGMGCREPFDPPKNIAPDHVPGTLCRTQRCTGCIHGVVFKDSLTPLARAFAELFFIKAHMPLAAWIGSSFEEEERSLSLTLELFDAEAVNAEVNAWLRKLETGEVIAHDTYPISRIGSLPGKHTTSSGKTDKQNPCN
ncbi:hypothetical protein [Microvirga sp. TS319]|uniref:hypothetical protein n=1 Tax=Microvirga sp. TS319 TaxID=3241165 RepID=UPI003519EF67